MKNYYGEMVETEEDSKYGADLSHSSDESMQSDNKSQKTSPQIKFSKLDGHANKFIDKHRKSREITESGFEETKSKYNLESNSKRSGMLKTNSHLDTKKTIASSSKNTMVEGNQNNSSLAITKVIVDSLAK